MRIPVLVIGGGLSGLAAAIRIARFCSGVLLVEKHSRLGGLNSYYYRNQTLFETGLHAITNYAEPQDRRAPLNRLLRQLKISRNALSLCPQYGSSIFFADCETLSFNNDIDLLLTEIAKKFPAKVDNFQNLLRFLEKFDPFVIAPFRSARTFLEEILKDSLLVDMLLCPLMYYGSSHEDDMDLAQFAIMFRAIFLEGMFRPQCSIKEFLDTFIEHLQGLGGTIRTHCGVQKIIPEKEVVRVFFESGEEVECDYLLSTIGSEETWQLITDSSHPKERKEQSMKGEVSTDGRLAFVENIFQFKKEYLPVIGKKTTILFFNNGEKFRYRQPNERIDTQSGVICFPSAFHGVAEKEDFEVRTTHLANYSKWAALDRMSYRAAKEEDSQHSAVAAEKVIGTFRAHTVFHDMFTPLTIQRYTGKIGGAIYGHPTKVKDGSLGFKNIFLAGTDQGFLGIVGSMLSGVSIVNQHILPKL